MNLFRIRLLLQRQWLENWKFYYVGTLSVAGILSFLYLIIWHWRTSFNGDTTKGVFLMMLFVGGGLFISSVFKDLGNKQKGMWLLTLPASPFEKLLTAMFYGIVLYLIVFIATFYFVEEIFLWMIGDNSRQIGRTDLLKNGFYNFLFTFINFQLVMLLGSISFNKSQWLKTVLILITIFFLSNFGNGIFLKFITGEASITSNSPMGGFQFLHNHENVYVILPPSVELAISILMRLIFPLILVFICYLKIKEKQL